MTAPVSGMPPDEIAIRLRNIIKEMVGAKAHSDDADGENDGYGTLPFVLDNISEYRNSVTLYRDRASEERQKLDGHIQDLFKAIPGRRVKEIRDTADQIVMRLRAMHDQIQYERSYVGYILEQVDSLDVGHSAPNSSLLEQAYSLVQGLPTVPNPPIGSAENTIRAVAAIVKAHYGILEGTVKEVPTAGSIDALLLTLAEEKKQEQASEVKPEDEFLKIDAGTDELIQYVKEGDTW